MAVEPPQLRSPATAAATRARGAVVAVEGGEAAVVAKGHPCRRWCLLLLLPSSR